MTREEGRKEGRREQEREEEEKGGREEGGKKRERGQLISKKSTWNQAGRMIKILDSLFLYFILLYSNKVVNHAVLKKFLLHP